jgi:hydroxymethylpyrimidine/phosphomethylpyrimidine kinase
MIKLLTIAGSDPSGGAGIQLDLKTFQALGAYGMAIPAALTVQNSKGVFALFPVQSTAVKKQIDSLCRDIMPHAIKTGMLLTKQNVEAVAAAVHRFRIKNLVIDPVLKSSSGSTLLQPAAISSLRKQLIPRALIVTPNVPEAEVLARRSISTERDMDYAAGALLDMGPSYVLIKGGHKRGPATDTLYGGKTVLSFSTARKKGMFHGTGCLLSSAITVFIGRGYPVEKAVEKAKQFVDRMLKTAETAGRGKTKYFQF